MSVTALYLSDDLELVPADPVSAPVSPSSFTFAINSTSQAHSRAPFQSPIISSQTSGWVPFQAPIRASVRANTGNSIYCRYRNY